MLPALRRQVPPRPRIGVGVLGSVAVVAQLPGGQRLPAPLPPLPQGLQGVGLTGGNMATLPDV